MKTYRCRICGDSCLGDVRPRLCPICGAHQKHVVRADTYRPTALGELSSKTRQGLEVALEQELGNTLFFRGAAKMADCPDGTALFSALARLQAARVQILCSLLNMMLPEDLDEPGESTPSHRENLAEATQRVERALRHYRKLEGSAPEQRVREVACAFMEVDTDHLAIIQQLVQGG